MFIGSVPKAVVEQILSVIPFNEWGQVFVGCSGSFRVDRAIKEKFPHVKIYSNDVSLLSVALGRLITGSPLDFSFMGRLAFIEEVIPQGNPADRVAAILVALDMSRYKGQSEFAKAHFDHYRNNFLVFVEKSRPKVESFCQGTSVDGFYAGDFLQQVERAKQSGGGLIAFPPTYKGGYERNYQFLDQNTTWERPEYSVWNPEQIGEFIEGLKLAEINYCVLTDRLIEGLKPVTEYISATNKPVYTFARTYKSSLRGNFHRSMPFRYTPVDSVNLHENSQVQAVSLDVAKMNFLKDRYLAKGIVHVSGMLNFAVFLDDRLAGGFIYNRSKNGNLSKVYLLSDFSVSRERKLSKLIAMLATCRDFIRLAENKFISRVDGVVTTAFTHKPVSMKYRGIYKLVSRKPGFLQYEGAISSKSPQDIYMDWFNRYARNSG